VIISREPRRLEAGFQGRQTLWQMGYVAVTGTVVWNQRRPDLRTSAEPGAVPLVWSRDLRGRDLDPKDGWPPAIEGRAGRSPDRSPGGQKPGFIRSDRSLCGPALLINRVVGSVGSGELRNAMVPEGVEFLAENHVNVVRRREGVKPLVSWQELQRRIGEPDAGERLRLMTGNTQISATELTHLLPV
jgi:hypothetical protein